MQHASGLMAVEDSGGVGQTRATSYSYMTDEDEDRYNIKRTRVSIFDLTNSLYCHDQVFSSFYYLVYTQVYVHFSMHTNNIVKKSCKVSKVEHK